MNYETVIGLEIHVELATEHKIFCGCSTRFGAAPNSQCCPVCTGMPGTLPVLNSQVVDLAIAAGIVTNCQIVPYTAFDRKNYFYPDLPKGYQISQLYSPICQNGYLEVETATGTIKKIRIREIHMEEDAGKITVDETTGSKTVDYNRCGVPLLEIVTQPDFRNGEEVLLFLQKLKTMLQFTKISDCKMQEGSLRVDVNLSVRPVGQKLLGTRTEMKNLNSFKAVVRAIAAEEARQSSVLEAGGCILQETRRWEDAKGCSSVMRSKEDAGDYRYFPEPDLNPIMISPEKIETVKATLPELPEHRKMRYIEQYGLSSYAAESVTASPYLSDLFEQACTVCSSPKEIANWIMGEWMQLLHENNCGPENGNIDPVSFGKTVQLVKAGTISRAAGKQVLQAVWLEHALPLEYVEAHHLSMVSDEAQLREIIVETVREHRQSVMDYKAGKEKALGFLMGQVMKQMKGKANPATVNRLLKEAVKTDII